jgi:hypothetical protein
MFTLLEVCSDGCNLAIIPHCAGLCVCVFVCVRARVCVCVCVFSWILFVLFCFIFEFVLLLSSLARTRGIFSFKKGIVVFSGYGEENEGNARHTFYADWYKSKVLFTLVSLRPPDSLDHGEHLWRALYKLAHLWGALYKLARGWGWTRMKPWSAKRLGMWSDCWWKMHAATLACSVVMPACDVIVPWRVLSLNGGHTLTILLLFRASVVNTMEWWC